MCLNKIISSSMIKNAPLATRNRILILINQSFTEGRLPTKWKMVKIIPIPKKDKASPQLTTSVVF